jgi:hypothetical protein
MRISSADSALLRLSLPANISPMFKIKSFEVTYFAVVGVLTNDACRLCLTSDGKKLR